MMWTWCTYTNKSTCSLLRGKANHTLRTSQVAGVRSQQKTLWQSHKDNPSSLKANQILEQQSYICCCSPVPQLMTFLADHWNQRQDTPDSSFNIHVLEKNGGWLPQSVYQAETPTTNIMLCHAASYCQGWGTAAQKVTELPSGPAAGAAHWQRPCPTLSCILH